LSILKAALNQAHDDGRVATTDAWAQVKAYRGVDSARLRYLSDDEARRLVNACRADFRQLVTAALLTGCRFGELAAVSTEDFNSDSGTITIRTSKSGKPRHVVLTDEGREFFTGIRIGADADLPLLTKANGRPWSASDQQRPLVAACSAAHVAAITFHGLRHTYASRLVMKGVPLPVVAAQLGHSDTRMVEKHYGHLAPTYVADTVRAAFDRMGLGHEMSQHSYQPRCDPLLDVKVRCLIRQSHCRRTPAGEHYARSQEAGRSVALRRQRSEVRIFSGAPGGIKLRTCISLK
jgi:integrase